MTTVSHVSEKIDSDSTEAAGAELHNSDLRDYHEYIQKKCGMNGFFRGGVAGVLVETFRLTKACKKQCLL